MSRTVSPSSKQPYGVARVTRMWNLARSSFYAARQRQLQPQDRKKRGPKVHSDEDLVAEIRQLMAAPVFTGEGYRKIWARLRHKGIRTSKDRVLRLMREHQLLSPSRQPAPTRSNPHEGTIVTEAPNQMWGTDATATLTEAEGAVTVFAAIDIAQRNMWAFTPSRRPPDSRRSNQFVRAFTNTSTASRPEAPMG